MFTDAFYIVVYNVYLMQITYIKMTFLNSVKSFFNTLMTGMT